jgi:hypothetical protein
MSVISRMTIGLNMSTTVMNPNPPHGSKHLFDIYSLTHTFWGLVTTILLLQVTPSSHKNKILITISSLFIAFEIHENLESQIIRYRRFEKDAQGGTSYRGDSTINIIGDIVTSLLGIYLGAVLAPSAAMFSLTIIFILVTRVLSLSYWVEFLKFLFFFKQF